MLSFYKQQIQKMLKLEATSYYERESKRTQKIKLLIEQAKVIDRSLLHLFYSRFCKKERMVPRASIGLTLLSLDESFIGSNECSYHFHTFNGIKSSARSAMIPLYLKVLRLTISILGLTVIAFAISLTLLNETSVTVDNKQIPLDLLNGLEEWLVAGSLVFQALFMIEVFCFHSRVKFGIYVDIVVLCATGIFNVLVLAQNNFSEISLSQVFIYIIYLTYMWIRSWSDCMGRLSKAFDDICLQDRYVLFMFM